MYQTECSGASPQTTLMDLKESNSNKGKQYWTGSSTSVLYSCSFVKVVLEVFLYTADLITCHLSNVILLFHVSTII